MTPRPKKEKPSEPLECDPIDSSKFEDAVKEVLLSDKPESQRSENREPTMEELNQKVKLERRQ